MFFKNSTPLAINPSTELPQLTLGSPEVPLMDSTRSPAAMGCVGLLLFHSGTAPSAWQRAKGIPKNLMGCPTSVGYNGTFDISWYFLLFEDISWHHLTLLANNSRFALFRTLVHHHNKFFYWNLPANRKNDLNQNYIKQSFSVQGQSFPNLPRSKETKNAKPGEMMC